MCEFLCHAAALNLKQYSGRYGGKWCANPYDVPLPEGTPLNRTTCPQTAVTVPQITPVRIACPTLLRCRPLNIHLSASQVRQTNSGANLKSGHGIV